MHRSPENHGYLNKLTLLRLLLARVRPECTITVAHSPLHMIIIARRPIYTFANVHIRENGVTATHDLQSIAEGAHDDID